MPENELIRLCRKRRRAVAELAKAEARATRYRSKLERTDARIQELDPRLGLWPDAQRKLSPIFKRGELARMALGGLARSREAAASQRYRASVSCSERRGRATRPLADLDGSLRPCRSRTQYGLE